MSCAHDVISTFDIEPEGMRDLGITKGVIVGMVLILCALAYGGLFGALLTYGVWLISRLLLETV